RILVPRQSFAPVPRQEETPLRQVPAMAGPITAPQAAAPQAAAPQATTPPAGEPTAIVPAPQALKERDVAASAADERRKIRRDKAEVEAQKPKEQGRPAATVPPAAAAQASGAEAGYAAPPPPAPAPRPSLGSDREGRALDLAEKKAVE